jgi:carboxypeptidase Taq
MENVFSKKLEKLFKESKNISTLQSIQQLISWDQETYMPKKAIDSRSDQLSALATLIHKKKTSEEYKKLLSELIDIETGNYKIEGLDLKEKASLREWRKEYLNLSKLPSSFVEKFAQTVSQSIDMWAKARHSNDFAMFEPFLQKIIDLNKEKAKILGYKKHPLDPLLDSSEPDMTVDKLEKIFPELKKGLIVLLQKIKSRNQVKDDFLHQKFSQEKQIAFNQKLLKILPIDQDICRLDISNHPFSTGIHPEDVRITTRIAEDFLPSNIFSVLHESGHAMYEMNLPVKYFGSPICEAISLGIHESQSRWWETLIGKSYSFCDFLFPEIKKHFPHEFAKVSVLDFYKAINKVESSLIRVEADEVTYSLHVIIRYEIEKALMEGSLATKDIPKTWNEKMKQYLSITPPTDSLGCLQDIHWSMGAIGYFPTYTLGNINAAQFFEKFKLDHPSYKEKLSVGDLAFIKDWLKENIHQYGKTYSADEICMRISGKKLSSESYLKYLNEKYSEIYGF